MIAKLVIMAALIGVATLFAADTISPQIGGGIGFTFDGGISGKKKAAAPPGNCNGTADYSQGCALLGGL